MTCYLQASFWIEVMNCAYKRSLLILEETPIVVVAQPKDICSQFTVKVGPNKRYIYISKINKSRTNNFERIRSIYRFL